MCGLFTVNIHIKFDGYPLPKIETLVNKLTTYCIFSTFNFKRAYYQLPLHEDDKLFTAFKAN